MPRPGNLALSPSHRFVYTLALVTLGVVSALTAADRPSSASGSQQSSTDGVWQQTDSQNLLQSSAKSRLLPERYRSVRLNIESLTGVLSRAPREVTSRPIQGETLLSLPLPDTGFMSFRIEESSVLEPELAAQYPEIKSYRGRGVEDASLWVRFDWTPDGLHALVTSSEQTFAVHRANLDSTVDYVVYAAKDIRTEAEDFICSVTEPTGRGGSGARPIASKVSTISAAITGPQLRTYRIAVATTQEYTNAPALGGGSVGSTIASINTWLNGINLIYEKDLALRFVLIASNSSIIYTAEPDPFSNGSTSSMINQARATINTQIGVANYDVGHVLGTQPSGGAGQAYLQVSCYDDYQGGGASLIAQNGPLGALGYVGLLVHEFGHQLGADHSFNASCSGNRSAGTAWESGSGLTVMSYASQCQPDHIVTSKSFHFHSGSIAQIAAYFNSSGGNCAVQSATGNSSPAANGGSDYTIPRLTPFSLVVTASDPDAADNANLSISWEQIDAGGTSYLSPPYTDSGDTSATTRPIFRPFIPSSNVRRTFPGLTYILNNANSPPAVVGGVQTAENLPAVGRELNLNVAVRDGHGGTSIDSVRLTVAGAAGPFTVTQPNTNVSWTADSVRTITWNVSGTSAAPVSCAQVRILLSSDGGQTFPIVLAASTPNDGTESVLIPANPVTSTARIKVEAVGNIFFDTSDVNFSIAPANSCPGVSSLGQTIGYPGTQVDINGISLTGVTNVRFGGGVNSSFVIVNDTRIRATVPSGAVTGPIQLSKSGCADASSPSFTVSSSPAVSIAVDDGSFESAYTAGGYAVNRLTPASYPATLSSVSIYFASFTSIQPGASIELLVGSNLDGDSNIDGTAFQVTQTTVQAVNQWNVYTPSNLTINSGDFVVGFRYFPAGGVFPVVFDRSPPAQGRSYASSDGASFVLQDSFGATYVGNAGIRASAFLAAAGPPLPATIRINPATIPRGMQGMVTVDLLANGGSNAENTVRFSLSFDQSKLSFVSAVGGSSGAGVTTNTSQTGSGLLGITAAKSAGVGFAAGTNQIAVITFAAGGAAQLGSTPLSFGDSPLARDLIAINGQSLLPANWTNSTVTISEPLNLEADVAPRPTGSGTVVVSDWVQVGRFSVGLDTAALGIEFQRADCAPRATLGDGQVSVADWVQAGRYSVGLDTVVSTGGPSSGQSFAPLSVPPAVAGGSSVLKSTGSETSVVRAMNAEFKRVEIGSMDIELDAVGNESALSFTLNYDSTKAVFVDATTAEGVPGSAALVVNAKQASRGRVAIALALPSGVTFTPGTQRLLRLRFLAAGGVEPTTLKVKFDDSIVRREIVASDATRLQNATFNEATVSISGTGLAVVSAASFESGMMAPESIAAAFGVGLAVISKTASAHPLPLELGGTTVTVVDAAGVEREAPLFFVSENQVNFQIPKDSALGFATVSIRSASGRVTTGQIRIVEVAPALFSLGGVAAGHVFRVGSDGFGAYEPLGTYDVATGTMTPVPIDLGDEGDVVHLVLYGTGIRKRELLADVKARIGGIEVQVEYAGAHGSLIGVDQINLRLPRELKGRGDVRIELEVDDIIANIVTVRMQN